MNLFRWFRSKKSARPVQAAPRRVKPGIERLEVRDVPAVDFITLTGTGPVTLNFEFDSRNSHYWNEIGVYTIDDDLGRVGDFLPGERGYARAALDRAETVFVAGDFEGAQNSVNFNGGTRLAFYMIQNNTLENWQDKNPLNRNITSLQAFFSIDAANRDGIEHFKSSTHGDRSMTLRIEDTFGGGDRDYNDAVVKLEYAEQDTSLVRGVAGQQVPATFTYQSRDSFFRNEVGIFFVDDAEGTIDGVAPGEEGYAEEVLRSTTRRVLFSPTHRPGKTRDVNLPGGTFFGLYLVQNGTAASMLTKNRDNDLAKGPVMFFSLAAANPDGFEHIRWLGGNRFGFEDGVDQGDRDFNDFVGTFTMRKPPNSAPFVAAAIADKTGVGATKPTEVIDLSGVFDDRDLANSRVRFNTNFGPIDMVLFDRQAPRTVANFYNYITNHLYDNVIFHRSADSGDEDFVLQGGGFEFATQQGAATGTAASNIINVPDITFSVGDLVRFSSITGLTGITEGTPFFVTTVDTTGHDITVAKSSGDTAIDITADGTATAHLILDRITNASTPTVQNEFSAQRSNVRGTLAMAKSAGNPNSATSEFFVNLNDNSGVLNNQNGGFTVFGQILDAANMQRIDTVAAVRNFVQQGTATAVASTDVITTTMTFGVGDRVKFFRDGNNTLPGGITEGTIFTVLTVSGADITISLTPGGSTVNITTDGSAIAQKVHVAPFDEIPLKNYTTLVPDVFPADAVRDNFFLINSVSILSRPEFLRYEVVSNTDPLVVSATIDPIHANRLTLDYLAAGTSTITIKATDKKGNSTTDVFTVTLT